jgi:hypothetical protein
MKDERTGQPDKLPSQFFGSPRLPIGRPSPNAQQAPASLVGPHTVAGESAWAEKIS